MKEETDDDTYEIIKVMRGAKKKYCENNGLEESFFCVDITAYEMDSKFKRPLRKVADYEFGFDRFWMKEEK